MRDLQSGRWIYAKGFLFLLIGTLTSILLLLRHPSLRTAILLAVTVWSFSRFYYFAFYVVQHYVDDRFRFASLFDFALYLIRGPRFENRKAEQQDSD